MALSTEKIWQDFHRELLRFITQKVKNADQAQDILQDVFIKIHLKIHTLTDHDKLAAWVYQIARNSILDHFRRLKPAAETIEDLPIPEVPEDMTETFAKCVQPFVNQLPETSRTALLQTDLGQLSQKAFAEKAGISHSGAKSRVQRGRQQLMALFAACCASSADKYGNIIDFAPKTDCSCP